MGILRCRDRRVEIGRRTLVMGIINVTPDSFSGDGMAGDVGAAVALAGAMVAQGAALLEVGGESPRPGALPVPGEVERARVVPVVAAIAASLDVAISVDTRKPAVAEAALRAGAHLINDVAGLQRDPAMGAIVA